MIFIIFLYIYFLLTCFFYTSSTDYSFAHLSKLESRRPRTASRNASGTGNVLLNTGLQHILEFTLQRRETFSQVTLKVLSYHSWQPLLYCDLKEGLANKIQNLPPQLSYWGTEDYLHNRKQKLLHRICFSELIGN